MKRTVSILLAAALVGVSRPASAQMDLELSPFAGGTFFLHDGPRSVALERRRGAPEIVEDARFLDSWSAGATVGLRLTELVAVEALLSWVPTWLVGDNLPDGTDVYGYMYGLNGVLHLPLRGPVRPFAGAGVGARTYDYSGSIRSQTQWTTTFLAGVSVELGEGRALRIQGRDVLAPFHSVLPRARGWENDLMITAGMSWRVPLGGRRAFRRPGVWPDFDPKLPLP